MRHWHHAKEDELMETERTVTVEETTELEDAPEAVVEAVEAAAEAATETTDEAGEDTEAGDDDAGAPGAS